MRRSLLLVAALAGCATVVEEEESNAPAGPPVEGINYETSPCFGACPVYRIALNADGTGLVEGRHGTALSGERSFRITPQEYRRFAAHLEPVRPPGAELSYTEPPLCETMATDLPGVEVRWYWADGSQQRLYFYYGCDMERYRAMADRLRSAPSLLPIAELIAPPG